VKALKPIHGNRVMSVEEAMKIVEGMSEEEIEESYVENSRYMIGSEMATYGEALKELHEIEGENHPLLNQNTLPIPLTMQQTMEAIIDNYEWKNDKGRKRSNIERNELLFEDFSTCSYMEFFKEEVGWGSECWQLQVLETTFDNRSIRLDSPYSRTIPINKFCSGKVMKKSESYHPGFYSLFDKEVAKNYFEIIDQEYQVDGSQLHLMPESHQNGLYPLELMAGSFDIRPKRLDHSARFLILK